MSEHLSMEPEVIANLLENPAIIKIVIVLDLRSLSILDLLEYGMTTTDVNYALANRIIQLEKAEHLPPNKENMSIRIPQVGGDYYYEFLNSRVMLTQIGLYFLDSLKCDQEMPRSPYRPKEQYSRDISHYLQKFRLDYFFT
jgi:hypothetical protein